jgi:hypothetical protein
MASSAKTGKEVKAINLVRKYKPLIARITSIFDGCFADQDLIDLTVINNFLTFLFLLAIGFRLRLAR